MSDVNVNVEPESQPRLGEAAIRSDFLALTDEARNAIVSSKATCPFIGSAIASGLLPIRGGTEEPLAAIDDVRSLGNSGGGDLGDLLAFFASGNHARIRGADGALDALVPAGLFSLDFPGSQGSHPGHSGILESDAAARGSGRVSEAEFERLAARARDGWLSRSAVGSFIAENLRRDPRAKVFGPRTALLLARDAASFASEAGPLLMRQLHASQPGSDAHREIEEKLTRLLGEDNLVGSAGEFGLLFAFFANRPGADALDHDPTLPLADVRRMFIDKRLPDGWDRWPKRRVDWVLHTTALLVAAAKAYVLPQEAARMSTPQAPAPHDIAADVTPQHQGQAAAGVHMAPVPVLNPDRPVPRANTGSRLRDIIADASVKIMQIERRFDPFFRRPFDALLQEPLARLVTALINSRRVDEHFALAEERPIPDEEAWVQSIIDTFRQQMSGLWKPGKFERGGNTKTHGIVRGEFVVHDDLPAHLRRGIFAEPHTFRAWVRFSGPGPYITPDIDDVGFMSISIKLLGVPGPKLMDEEKLTQEIRHATEIRRLEGTALRLGPQSLHDEVEDVRFAEVQEVEDLGVLDALELQLRVGVDVRRHEGRRRDAEHVLGELFLVHQLWPRHTHQLDADAHEAHIFDIRGDVRPRPGEANPGAIGPGLGVDTVPQLGREIVVNRKLPAHNAVGFGVAPSLEPPWFPE